MFEKNVFNYPTNALTLPDFPDPRHTFYDDLIKEINMLRQHNPDSNISLIVDGFEVQSITRDSNALSDIVYQTWDGVILYRSRTHPFNIVIFSKENPKNLFGFNQ